MSHWYCSLGGAAGGLSSLEKRWSGCKIMPTCISNSSYGTATSLAAAAALARLFGTSIFFTPGI